MYLERIERYISYYTKSYNLINSISEKNDYSYKLHKKILYISIIDSLSGIIYPNKSPRQSFTKFISGFSNWNYAEYISIPHLSKLLILNPDPKFSVLRKFIFSKIDNWKKGSDIYIDKDLNINEIKKYWPKKISLSEKISGASLDSLKHIHLFYNYRNSLIHSFIALGTDLEVPEHEEPYYWFLTSSNHWDLIYPTEFLNKICKSLIENTETFLKENRIDPIEIIKSGRYWLKQLNKQ